MTTNPNPIQPPLEKLFARLNVLYGLLLHLDNQLTRLGKLYQERLEKRKSESFGPFLGSYLAIKDLTKPYPSVRLYHTGTFTISGEEYLRTRETLVHREAAWTISQAYEAFETFLKDVIATYLHNNRRLANAEKLRKIDSRLRGQSLQPDNFRYWREFVQLTYRGDNNAKLFECLRELAPEINNIEKSNYWTIDLTEWYKVVSEIRHAATHSDLLIKSERIRSWSQAEQGILTQSFSGESTAEGYRLCLTRENARENLSLFAEYAYVIFKHLSKTQGYPDIFNPSS